MRMRLNRPLAILLCVTMIETISVNINWALEGAEHQTTSSALTTIDITDHKTDNLGNEIDAYMAANGILTPGDILSLNISGGSMSSADKSALYSREMNQSLKSMNLSGTSFDKNILPSYAFGNFTALKEVILPNNITHIMEWAFSNCTSLETVHLPSSLTQIDSAVFFNSSALKDIDTTSATPPVSFHPNAFMNVSSFAAIHVPKGSESTWDSKDLNSSDGRLYQLQIEDMAPILHYTQTRITDSTGEINISSNEPGSCYYAVVKDDETVPDMNVSAKEEVFNSSGTLTISLSWLEAGPYDIYIMAKDLHGNSTQIIKIDLEGYITPVDVIINNHITGNLATEVAAYIHSLGLSDRFDKIRNLKISGGSLDNSDWDTFSTYYDMTYAVQSIDFSGTSCQSIPRKTFQSCENIKEIFLPSGLQSIGSSAFKNCINLTSITIPESVTSIDANGFYGCSKLSSATFKPITAPAIEKQIFDNCNNLAFIHIPLGSTGYTGENASENWKALASKIQLPTAKYLLTVNGSYAEKNGAGNYTQGEVVTVNAGIRQNYSFNGWTSSFGGSFAHSNNASTTFIMPGNAVTITANWTDNGGSSSGGSSGGSSSSHTGSGSTTSITTVKPTVLNDISNHWAKNDIEFVVARGLLSGINHSQFDPDTAMTRGMFVTALGRLSNVDVSKFKQSSFTDVKTDTYYLPYVEWASKNDIVKGIGNDLFAPNTAITREEMAVIMLNYSKMRKDTLPAINAEIKFSDGNFISPWAKDGVKTMQMAGIIMGKDSSRFDPKGTAMRSEAAVILSRYIKFSGH